MNRKTNSKPHNIMFFSRWSRKNYAAFRSQGKQVMISTMVMAASLTFETQKATAQVDTTENQQVYELDEIVVSGEQEPVAFSKIARIVTVMNKKEIEQAPVSDLNELLEYALSLDIRQRGQNGVQADIAMRGGTFDQTLILLNGINLSDPQTGHHNLNLPLSLSGIERIEILEGPSARAFGVNAFNGAINIITTASAKKQITALIEAGQFAFRQQNVAVSSGTRNTSHFISAGHKQSKGYLPHETLNNTDFNTSNLFYHGKWGDSNQEVNLQAGYNRKHFGANSFYTPAYPEQAEATETWFGSIQYQITNNKISIKPSIYYRKHNDRFELFRDTAPDWYTTHNYHTTDVAGGQIPFALRSKIGTFSVNASIRYAHIYSNVLGKTMAQEKPVPGENAFFTKEDERFHSSLHAIYALDLDKFYLSAGIMMSHYNILQRMHTYPGIEASYETFENLRVFAAYNEALRLPTFTDMYYSGPTNIGNPDLKPEESETMEAGLKYVNSLVRLQGAFFFRQGKNIIEWVKAKDAPEDTKWQTENITKLNTKGVDVSASLTVRSLWKNSPVKKIKLSYAYVDVSEASSTYITKYVADHLKHKISGRVSHTIYKNFYAEWGIHYQDRNGTYTAFENGAYGEEVPYSPFWLTNLKSGWKSGKWNIYMTISNLFDKKYYDLANVPLPGRWMKVGLRYMHQ